MANRGRKLLCGAAVLTCLFAPAAQAEFNGEIRPRDGTHIYNIDMDTTVINDNRVGAEYSFDFNVSGTYQANVYCTTKMERTPIIYNAEASLLQPGSTGGFLKLNDYMDVKVSLSIFGSTETGVTFDVPFEESNGVANACAGTGWETLATDFRTGSVGRVTFRITKPIINGLNLTGTEVAKLWARMANGDPGRGIPMAQVNINSGVITVPDECTFNNGTPINVPFNTIPGTASRLDGINYSQPLTIPVKCKGGSFANGDMNINLSIRQANPASFNSDYLSTSGTNDRSNLGIRIRDDSNTTIVPNKFYPATNFANNEGSWNLTAAPIANGGTDIPEGAFEASATVVAEFQ